MEDCYKGIAQTDKITEECEGQYTNDACIIHEQAILSLGLPSNSPIKIIVNALVSAITYKEEQIQILIGRIEALENQ